MDYGMFLGFTIFGIVTISFSKDIWNNPDKFIKKIRKMEEEFYRPIFGSLMNINYAKHINQKKEIWLARIGFLFVYGVIIFGIYHSFK